MKRHIAHSHNPKVVGLLTHCLGVALALDYPGDHLAITSLALKLRKDFFQVIAHLGGESSSVGFEISPG